MKIGIVGSAGRMGRLVAGLVLGTEGCELSGGTEQPGSDAIGQDIAVLAGLDSMGLEVGGDAEALFKVSDTVIDFTSPDATMTHAALAGQEGVALVVGTTGLETTHRDALKKASERAVIVQAANMSVGVNVLLGLTRRVAGLLDDGYDIEISEIHHRDKVDAPSGTALALGEEAAAGRGVKLGDVSQRARDGHTGARKAGGIGFSVMRGGDVAGEHTVVFAGSGERVELTHRANDRAIFARGAIKAALWTEGREAGLYSMLDVLGLDR